MRVRLEGQVVAVPKIVVAELGWACDRPELGALCAAGQGGLVTEETVARLVPGLSPAGAANVLRHCEDLGLIRGGGLTADGEEAARSGRVFVPEVGAYLVWRADDAVVPLPVLHVQRWRPQRTDRGTPSADVALGALGGRTLRSLCRGGAQVRVRRLSPGHRAPVVVSDAPGLPAPATLRLTVELGATGGRWAMTGRLGDLDLDPEVAWGAIPETAPALMEELQEQGALAGYGRWSRERLAVPFDDRLAPAMRTSFKRDLELDRPTALGRPWGRGHITGLGLEPDGASAAAEWALDLLRSRLEASPRHRGFGELWALHTETVRETPLEPFRPRLPPPDELGSRWADAPRLRWSVLAAHDLTQSQTQEAA